MCLCGLFSQTEGVQMLSTPIEKTISQWMSLFLKHNHISLHPRLLFSRRVREKRIFLVPFHVSTSMPEQEKQLTNESPTEPIDKLSGPPAEELRVYSRR
jgi:hypothetical protein